ncbi:phosphotransferase system HPr (HPr) family protein [Neobacillus niacini]|uniref:HPr family phosphocarrier protein n=1 Tax=Neobacillus niacini TaxID=86668 RepID=UPI002785B744|nr:HPr family phosphocarrier protein [Neobacillus niacini]MDQ1005418.1 phosphotransferase system HPr (HPr) family protein [Neobacillus niacini]
MAVFASVCSVTFGIGECIGYLSLRNSTKREGSQLCQKRSNLCSAANQFSSETILVYKQKQVSLKLIIGIMTIGITPGEAVKITAAGEDERDVIEKIKTVIDLEGIGVESQAG